MLGNAPIRAFTISIHALREEGDTNCLNCQRSGSKFQSTPSARRATQQVLNKTFNKKISIHALREEGDMQGLNMLTNIAIFQSTPSARRATGMF